MLPVTYPRINIALNLIKEYIELNQNQINSYLDLGCNNGYNTILIKQNFNVSNVFGVDFNQGQALKIARNRGLNVCEVDLSESQLPFNDNYFDLVTAFEVIEHLRNPDNMLKEVHRVLRPNGLFIISTPNLGSWLNRIILLLGYQPTYSEVSTEILIGHIFDTNESLPDHHLRLFTLRSLNGLLHYHGYTCWKVKGSGSKNQKKIIQQFDKLFNSFPSLSRILIVGARKYKTNV